MNKDEDVDPRLINTGDPHPPWSWMPSRGTTTGTVVDTRFDGKEIGTRVELTGSTEIPVVTITESTTELTVPELGSGPETGQDL